ncbi:MAG: Ig-like domain-containing protein, partial [Parcubacteria group bacterium]|nr:Ig-like domain-containing protein [Parcubacteria group bacterium]
MRRLPIAASIGVPSKARFARITLLACLLAAAFLFASPSVSFAQTAGDSTQNFGLDSEFSQVAVQSDRDLKSVITTIVNIALGFLGTVAVIIIIYAGYLWMTASGNEEQITRAKSILRNAVIGLVIIMASWAIAAFVINRLGGAIGGGSGGGGSGFGGLPPGSGSSAAFVVSSVETSHIPPEGSPKERVTMCSSVQAQFNHYVGEDSFEDLKDGEELAVMYRAGEVVLKESSVRVARRNNVVSFKRENGDGSRADWQPQTTYDVRLAKELRDGRGLALANCADCDSEEEQFWRWTFATGQVSDRDVIAPRVGAVYPEDGATGVPRSAIFSVSFSEAVDAESLMAADGSLNAGNIILQRNDPQTGSFGAPFAGSMFDVTVRESGILFSVNASYTAIDGARGALEPYTEYRLIIQGIQDLCGNPLDLSGEDDTDADGIPDIDIVFETGADLPGVSFVRPSDGYAHSCPATPAFVQFRTSMYNIRTQSCVVDPNGLGGLVLGGSLNPAGVTLRSGPEDNFSGTGSPMDYCRQYAFNLNPNDAADDLIPGTEYTASIDFIKPGGDSANAENHAWSFTAAGASACAQEPYLNYVSGLGRNQGQWRQCLTASGAHFGDSKAASSRIATALSLDSPRNLPLLTQPITDAWTSHERIAVPDTNWSSESIAADFIGPPAEPIPSQPKVDFDIAVEVDHGAPIGVLTSNAVRFAVDTTQTFNGPCLYSISPTAGYWGDSVTLTGSRLGLAPAGQMTFYNQKTQAGSSAALWSNTRIQSRVPDLAQNNPADGEVFVTVGGVQSNKLEFNLRAGVGQSCALDASVCAPGLECSPESLTCQAPDTFRVTSVQPVAACTDSCASAVISFEASKPIKDVSGNRVQLKKCPTASRCSWNDPGASPVGVSVSRDGVQRAIITPQTAGNTLDLNAWYLVRVAGGPSGVVATDGKTIANLNADTDGTAREDAYVWSFKTGSSACTVNRIEMNQPDIGLFEGESADISIRSYGPSNSCAPRGQELVVPDNFTWRGCAYVDGDVSFECRASCSAPVLGGEAIITVASGSSSRSTVTGSAGSSDGSLRAFACAFYDEGGTHLKDGAIATVYAACTANADCTQGGACAGSVCLQDGANKGRC